MELDEQIKQVQAGNLDAFAEIVQLHERPIRAWLVSRCPPGGDADEVAQKTFVQAFKRIDDYEIGAGDGNQFTSPLILPPEQTTLWVGKIISREQGEDEIYFRVYGEQDVLGYAEPSTWHVVTRGVDIATRLDRVLLSSTGQTAKIVDELRIGPTWRSIAPMQEGI